MIASAFDLREFRAALGAFPTGVTIVTTRGADGTHIGLTVNSFNSLSLEPPLILWSLSAGSPRLAVFEAASHFAVNILCEDQAEISQHFASRIVDKFEGVEVSPGAGGAPLIAGCSAWLECRNYSRQKGGDHVLFIGEVERFSHSNRKPLIFSNGKYLFSDRQSDAPGLYMGWGF